jgi:hypothetical protein
MDQRVPRRRLWLLASTACAVVACASPDEMLVGDPPEPIAVPGPWKLPGDVLAIAQMQYVAYDDAPPWDGGAHCSGTFYSGARKFRDYLLASYPGVDSIGGYNCRPNTANPANTSIHGTGRALDVIVSTIDGDADNNTGDEIGNWLVSHAEYVGIQLVIWDRSVWQASLSGDKLSPYTGPNPHIDHLHVELTIQAAELEATEFFERAAASRTSLDPAAMVAPLDDL